MSTTILTFDNKPVDRTTPLAVKVGGKDFVLVPVGEFKTKVRKEGMKKEDVDKLIALTKDTDVQFGVVKIEDYEVLSTAQIDEPAIRKQIIDTLGVKNSVSSVLLFNWFGFTGKAEGVLLFKGPWETLATKAVEVKEINIYDALKGLLVSGKTSMKSNEVTPSRIVRAFKVQSKNYFLSLKTPGPFLLDTNNAFCWWYGGIYNCENTYTQLGHFLGMAFALKNKPVSKQMPLDFPAGYVRRAPPSEMTLMQFIVVATYMQDGSKDLKDFKEAFESFNSIDVSKSKEMFKKVEDPVVITYIMGLGAKFTLMLPAKHRLKFSEKLLSTNFKSSNFNTEPITEAKKLLKDAKAKAIEEGWEVDDEGEEPESTVTILGGPGKTEVIKKKKKGGK